MSQIAKPSFIVRKLELNDCEEVRNISKEVQFIIAKYNNEVMIKVDPNGLFVAQDTQTGQLLGILNGVNLTSNFAFIGQYAVRPQYQGLGIGSELWKKAMEHIGSERNISLFAAERMFKNYRDRSGFVIVPEKRMCFYLGKANCDHLVKQIEGISLVHINQDNLQSVVEYDKQISRNQFNRSVVIEEYSKTPETVSLVAIHEKTNQVIGYCITTVTNFNTGTVEPLYADNEEIAELLIGKCCELLPITIINGIFFQCWDSNEKAIAIAEKMGLNFSKKEPILFTKQVIEGKPEKIFCVSSRGFYPF